MPSVQHKRGTRSQVNAAAAANGLKIGEIYLITDENRLAIGTGVSTYQDFAKLSEISGAADINIQYSSNATITMDLSGLASSGPFTTGRESNQIDNTTNKYVDALVSGSVSVGTTPTPNTTIAIYVWGADTSLATTAIDQLDGADSTEVLTNAGILNALRLGATIAVPANTSDVQYFVLPFSIAALFGGVMPKFWGLFVAHNTVASLRTSALNTNSFEYVGINYVTS